MSFAVVVEAVVGLAVGTVLVGGRKARETGWRLVCGLLMVAGEFFDPRAGLG